MRCCIEVYFIHHVIGVGVCRGMPVHEAVNNYSIVISSSGFMSRFPRSPQVSTLSRQREEMLALNRERNGELLRLVRMEETCRRLEEGERVREGEGALMFCMS